MATGQAITRFCPFSRHYPSMPIILILGLLIGGGVSIAAEQSLPGDALYPIKISVNETVRGGLSFSSESKASFEVKKAEKRLIEAEELAAEGKLNADTRAQIEANFDRFAERVAVRIAEVQKENPEAAAEIAARFETALSAHEATLAQLAVNASADAKTAVTGLVAKVKTYSTQGATAKANAQAAVQAQTSTGVQAQTANTQATATTETNANIGSSTQGSIDLKVKLGN